MKALAGSRSRILAIGLFVVMALFVVQLFYIQVIAHNYYEAKAETEHISKLTIAPKRGTILALDGNKPVPLVLNEPIYTAYADPQVIDNKAAIAGAIREIAGGNTVADFEAGLDNKKLRYTILARGLSRTQAELLKIKQLAGVGLQEADRRVYPEGSLAAQLLGFVDSEGKGQYGIEAALDERLRGAPGLLQAVTDVRKIPLTIGKNDIRRPPRNGDDLVLSVDRGIQSYTEEALVRGLKNAGATTGSVVVMNPNNGQVMAMANYPTYDPAKYNQVEDYSLFQNKTVSEPYEAGSVFKTLTVGIGLDAGVISSGDTFNNRGYVQVDDTEITNVEEAPNNPAATITDILRLSLNTGAVHVLSQLGGGDFNRKGRDALYDYFANRFGFGKKTGIEQANEQPGIIISPQEVQGNNVRYANMTFGQGLDVTMIQTAAAFSSAINGGTYYKPTLLSGTRSGDNQIKQDSPKVVRSGVISSKASRELVAMVHTARQAGFFKGKDRAGYQVGGKTGTSQIIDPATGKYTDDNSIGTYLGFGGGGSPQYVIMVQVKDAKIPGYAGTVAAGPIFTDISNWLLQNLKVEPTR